MYDIIDLWPESMPIDRYKGLLPFKYGRIIVISIYQVEMLFSVNVNCLRNMCIVEMFCIGQLIESVCQ